MNPESPGPDIAADTNAVLLLCEPRDALAVAAWDGAGGIGGLFERMFAPRVLRAIYADEFKRLDAYAREHRSP